jgi:hypothetical protein
MWQALSIWLLVYPLFSPYKENVFYFGWNKLKISGTLNLQISLISDYNLFTLCKGFMNRYGVVISEYMKNDNNKTVKHNIIKLSTFSSLTFNYK